MAYCQLLFYKQKLVCLFPVCRVHVFPNSNAGMRIFNYLNNFTGYNVSFSEVVPVSNKLDIRKENTGGWALWWTGKKPHKYPYIKGSMVLYIRSWKCKCSICFSRDIEATFTNVIKCFLGVTKSYLLKVWSLWQFQEVFNSISDQSTHPPWLIQPPSPTEMHEYSPNSAHIFWV